MTMADLIFTHYAAEEDFLITSGSDRGDLWLVDNADTTSAAPEADIDEVPIVVGNSWIKDRAEFERLYAKARADGLTVQRESE
jgi:hypothetical protein